MAHDPVYTQPNFRIRSDDTVGLNTDSGWEDVINADVTMDAGKVFRVRFEVEETAGYGGSQQFQLQYRIDQGSGYGSWTDVGSHDVPSEEYLSAIIAWPSSQYTDGAATTNLLSGTSASFTAGTGEEDPTTASVTVNSNHTEFEFGLLIRGFWYNGTTMARITTNDTIQLRLVESGGTAFTGTYVNPTITVNVPAGYIGGINTESPCDTGPFIDTNGNLYLMQEVVGNTYHQLNWIKSTDGGDTWTLENWAGRPTERDLESVDIQQVGDTLHCLLQCGASDREVRYSTFLTSDHATNPDTWDVTNESVVVPTNAPSDQGCSIMVRSDDTVVAFYRASDGTYDRGYYKIRSSGGTWGSENSLDDTGTVDLLVGRVAKDTVNDRAHIFYRSTTTLYHKSLNSSDTLSGRDTLTSDLNLDDEWPGPIAFWQSGTDEKVLIVYADDTDNVHPYSVTIVNDGTPDTAQKVASSVAVANPGTSTSEQRVEDVAVDGTTIYYVWYLDPVKSLKIRDKSDSGAWGNETDISSLKPSEFSSSVGYVRGNVFTHSATNGGDTVYGFLIDHDDQYPGLSYYKEHVISVGSSGDSNAALIGAKRAQRATFLRM